MLPCVKGICTQYGTDDEVRSIAIHRVCRKHMRSLLCLPSRFIKIRNEELLLYGVHLRATRVSADSEAEPTLNLLSLIRQGLLIHSTLPEEHHGVVRNSSSGSTDRGSKEGISPADYRLCVWIVVFLYMATSNLRIL